MEFKRSNILALSALLLLAGCTAVKSIAEIKNEAYIGEVVSVRGVVIERIALGDISGFIIKDSNNDTIMVSSESLPGEGDTVTVTGNLSRNILGYYITQE